MYHFIYETTNLITGKKYRGAHSTNNMNDGYLGSGKRLIKSIKKFGKENFSRTILEFCDDSCSLMKAEAKWVDQEWIQRKDTYNLKTGGKEGLGYRLTNEQRKKLSEAQKNAWKNPEYIKKQREVQNKRYQNKEERDKMSKIIKQKYIDNPELKKRLRHKNNCKNNCKNIRFKGKNHTKETKEKLSKKMKEIWSKRNGENQ